MPKVGNFWNLEDWLRRLGLETESPPLLPGVQPVVLLGDHSEVTSPLQAPTALLGGRFTAAVATHSSFAWRTLSPGGCFILAYSCRNDTGQHPHSIRIASGPRVLAAVITPLAQNMGPTPVLGVPRMGQDTIALGDLFPVAMANNQLLAGGPTYYLPPNFEIQLQSTTTGIVSNFRMLIRDVVVAIPSPT